MPYGYIISSDGTTKTPLYCQWVSYTGSFEQNSDVTLKTFTSIKNVRVLDVSFLFDSYCWFNCAYVNQSFLISGSTITLRARQTVTSATVTATCNVFIVYSKS